MQKRYYSGDWKPAELDGGQFCEAVARSLYQIDTNVITHNLLPNAICDQLLDRTKFPSQHNITTKDREHFCRVLQTTYKFRNDRGVAHISSIHTANHLDATLIVANVKWMFAEFLRLVWNKDRNEVVSIIEAIIQLEHPLIHELDGKPLILANGLSAPEEILLHLQHTLSGRLTRDELKQYVPASPKAIDMAITRLGEIRQIRISDKGEIVITPSGEERVREEIIPKANSQKNAKGRRSIATTTRKR